MPGGLVGRGRRMMASVYGLSGVLGPFTNNLPNSGGTVRLRNRTDAVLLEVNYDTQPPWPISPDGAGHSLVLARPSFGLADPRAWAASDAVGGSPGRGDPITTDPLSAVVINELLAHTDLPDLDFVELHNTSSQSLDLGGASLSDNSDTNKFTFPAGTTIPGHGFLMRNELQLGFALKAEGIPFTCATRATPGCWTRSASRRRDGAFLPAVLLTEARAGGRWRSPRPAPPMPRPGRATS
jgi:hypothetical protein